MKFLYKNHLVKLYMIVTISCLLPGCKPDEQKVSKDLGLFTLEEAKDYLYFLPGTWWIYSNSETNLSDTVVVVYSLIDTLEAANNKWHFREELFYVHSKSTTSGLDYFFWTRLQAVEVLNEPQRFYIPTLETDDGTYSYDVTPFYYPFKNRKDNYPWKTCIGIRDTMSINGITFDNVAIFYVQEDVTHPRYPLNKENAAKYYWSKNHGLIRKDIFDSNFRGDTSKLHHSLNLIKFNIIQ